MKVLALNPSVKGKEKVVREGRCSFKSLFDYTFPPISLAYISSILKKDGIDIKLVDGNVVNMSFSEMISLSSSYDLVVISVTTPTFYNDSLLIKEIRKKNVKVVVCGTHASTMPEECSKVADFVVVGEPEMTILELVKCLSSKGDILKVDGLAFFDDEFVMTKPRSLMEDLNSLPFPDRSQLDNKKYSAPMTKDGVAMILTSRGCPFQCNFCNAVNMYGRKFRTRSVENILMEVEEVINKYDIKDIVFYADTFTLRKDIVLSLCSEITKRGLKFRWMCNSRVDTLDSEMVIQMKKAGCWLINFGVESGNDDILKNVGKGINTSQVRKAFSITKKNGLVRIANFIFGLNGESRKSIENTIKFAKEIDPDFVYFFVATPYPGTGFYDYVVKEGLLVKDNFEAYSQSDNAVIRTKDMSSSELMGYVKKAYRSFFLRPLYLIRVGWMVLSKGGLVFSFKAGFSFLRWILRL